MINENDISNPPKGPMKWNWFLKVLNSLAKRARLISKDSAIKVTRTNAGNSISIDRATTGSETTAWIVSSAGDSRWECYGGGVTIDTFYSVEDKILTSGQGGIVALKIKYSLTAPAYNQTPIFREGLSPSQVVVTQPEIVIVNRGAFEEAQCAKPQSRPEGTIYIALAIIDQRFVSMLVGTTDFSVTLYHDQFLVTQ